MGTGRKKRGKGREREPVIISFTTLSSSAAFPSPQFPPVFFLFRAYSIPRVRLSRSLEQAISDSNLETGRNGSKSQVKSPGLSGRVDSPDVRYNFDLTSHVIVKRGNCSDDIAQELLVEDKITPCVRQICLAAVICKISKRKTLSGGTFCFEKRLLSILILILSFK